MESVGLPFRAWYRRKGKETVETGVGSEKTTREPPRRADRTPRVGFPALHPRAAAAAAAIAGAATDPMASDEPSTSALAKTPGKTFSANLPASWMNSAKTPSGKTPGGAKTPARLSLAKTPAGKPKTPGVSSMFSQAPERVVVDAKPKPKTPGAYHRQLMLPARKTPGKKGAPVANPAPSMLSLLPNATRAEFWLNKAIREEERSGDLAQALYHIDAGIKRGAEPVQSLREAKTALEARMRTEHAPARRSRTRAPRGRRRRRQRGGIRRRHGGCARPDPHARLRPRSRDGGDPVRRSARMTPDSSGARRHSPSVRAAMTHNSIQRTLSANDYAYVPNEALENTHANGADDVDDAVASLEAFRGDIRNAPPLTLTNDDDDDDDERGNVENRPRDDGVAGIDEASRRLMGVTPGVTTRTTPRSFTVNSSGKKSRGVVYVDSRGSSGGRNGRNGSLSKARSLDAPAPRKMSFSSHSGDAAGNDEARVVARLRLGYTGRRRIGSLRRAHPEQRVRRHGGCRGG